jgi:uncharacterized phage-associated protein
MSQFQFDKEKSVSVLLYITQNLATADFLRVFKVLYFAEQKHLVRFGRPIVGDNYLAMKHGLVPSSIYSELNNVESGIDRIFKKTFKKQIYFSDFFEVKRKVIKNLLPKIEPQLDYISESGLICLNESLEENKYLSFKQLSDKSHDVAWEKANENDEMDILEIAKSGGASDEMLNYISIMAENETLSLV